jgi:hypothetical protein
MKRFLLVWLAVLVLASVAVTPAIAQNPAPQCSVQDFGPSWHARGTLNGNIYTVAWGDTLFSISRRFNVPINTLASINGINNTALIYGGQRLTIPCPGQPSTSLTITAPAPNSVLPATFTVSGTTTGLPAGTIITVQARDNNGTVIAQQQTTLTFQAPGSPANWSVQLTVNAQNGSNGTIIATAPGSTAQASVPVTYGSAPVSPSITINAPAPNSVLPATFAVSGTGANVPGNQVIVQARAANGALLTQQQATLTIPMPGAQGTWSVQLTVNGQNGTTGTIVALGSGTAVLASVPVTYGSSPVQAVMSITAPAPNSLLPVTFNVSGTGSGLPGNQVIVQALTNFGSPVLAQQITTLNAPAPGGFGTWSVQLTVNSVANGTPGTIIAFGNGTSVLASVPVIYGSNPVLQPSLSITTPGPNTPLPATFTVNGTGTGLVNGSQITVQAQTTTGAILANQATTLQVPVPGGQGNWSVQLTVNGQNGTPGNIVASASGVPQPASVPVIYGSSNVGYRQYTPGQCSLQVVPGAALFIYPNGPQIGQFGGGGFPVDALASVKPNGQFWYLLAAQPATSNLPAWAPAGSVTAPASCLW